MADTKISALTAVVTPNAADEFAVNQSGTSKKETLAQITDNILLRNSVAFKNAADSTTGFQVLDQDGGVPILNVDTVNERVGIGLAAPIVPLDVLGAGRFFSAVDGANVLLRLENTQAHAAASLNETADIEFYFSTDLVGRIRLGKEDDYDPGVGEDDSFMSFWTDRDGTLTESMRLRSDGHLQVLNIRAPSGNNLELRHGSGLSKLSLRSNEVFIFEDLYFNSDDSDDIGQNSTSRRPRTIFVGTSISIGSGDGTNTLEVEDDTPSTGATRTLINQGAADGNHTVLMTVAGGVTTNPGGTVGVPFKYTKVAADLTDADTEEDEVLFNLPANGMVTGVRIKHSTAFSGGTLSAMTVEVGDSTSSVLHSAAQDIFIAVGDTVKLDTPQSQASGAAAHDIIARFKATGDNMVNVSAGSVDIWVFWVVLP